MLQLQLVIQLMKPKQSTAGCQETSITYKVPSVKGLQPTQIQHELIRIIWEKEPEIPDEWRRG